MIEKWKYVLDNSGKSEALLTDLSEAIDCLKHDLFIAKLTAYVFDNQSLRLINSYLFNRKQRTKINNAYSFYSNIFYGVPQGLIPRTLFFNIGIWDIFVENFAFPQHNSHM